MDLGLPPNTLVNRDRSPPAPEELEVEGVAVEPVTARPTGEYSNSTELLASIYDNRRSARWYSSSGTSDMLPSSQLAEMEDAAVRTAILPHAKQGTQRAVKNTKRNQRTCG